MELPEKMDLQNFTAWLQEKLPGEKRLVMNRVETVFSADNIEPGSFAALFAYMDGGELMICELASTFLSIKEAWAALSSEEVYTFRPAPFYQWAEGQYWTLKRKQLDSYIS
ncbi:MAG: hypothetical protein ABFD08_04495 [Syntrophomonas sp.]